MVGEEEEEREEDCEEEKRRSGWGRMSLGRPWRSGCAEAWEIHGYGDWSLFGS